MDLDVVGQACSLDRSHATAILRIFQEALTNVARHAQASKVEVRLIREGDELELAVQDNGRGIRLVDQAGAKSLGLAGIRERVRLLDGQCQIDGAPGEVYDRRRVRSLC